MNVPNAHSWINYWFEYTGSILNITPHQNLTCSIAGPDHGWVARQYNYLQNHKPPNVFKCWYSTDYTEIYLENDGYTQTKGFNTSEIVFFIILINVMGYLY